MPPSRQDLLRAIPSVDAILQEATSESWADGIPRRLLADAIRTAVARLRGRLESDAPRMADADKLRREILVAAREEVRTAAGPHYRKVINATGIILHTGLGRAVLPDRAIRQIRQELTGYSLLQVEIDSGKRSRRDARIEGLLQRLTGAEAATVVNNNAAATAIVLAALAGGREVIVSRGQLVEIGGSFRLPEVMAASGAKLVEVGTTNKTHPRDYEQAITENTAAILRVHPSNYRIQGFTSEVSLETLVEIAHSRRLPLIDDVGAGALFDYARLGLPEEPTLPGSIAAGADVVLSSADKLIGAAQGGIILGRADLIERIRKHPFARIVRVGKLTLAALEATLPLFLDEETAMREVPTLRMLRRPAAEISVQANRIAEVIRSRVPGTDVEVVDGFSQTGSGSLPGFELPTHLVAIAPSGTDPEAFARALRHCSPPVFTRIHKGRVLIDPRTLLDGEEPVLIEKLVEVLGAP